ncbi:hypothetical protein [Lentibacter sp. XHP0401]|jgi:hypothetical protein|uniref:hypothetical protein n=1 Tax=Lentibacter sp. XHP0401 TaxID=2984334 RepID=UPI0021E85E5C|nr:hypothetical protein [Lentibacter sp. XHP0401]MCV2891588.1 hypothetical protein [Lentibacter sp. XHP0401]
MRKFITCLLAALLTAGCELDREEDVKTLLSSRLYILTTMHFTSKSSCTAAVFTLALGEFRKGYYLAETLDTALERIRDQEPVQFALEGLNPNQITEAIMSRDLSNGLGLISSGIGPARDCMDAKISRGYYRVLLSEQTQMVYLPEENALLLLYPPERLAFFLRGNV